MNMAQVLVSALGNEGGKAALFLLHLWENSVPGHPVLPKQKCLFWAVHPAALPRMVGPTLHMSCWVTVWVTSIRGLAERMLYSGFCQHAADQAGSCVAGSNIAGVRLSWPTLIGRRCGAEVGMMDRQGDICNFVPPDCSGLSPGIYILTWLCGLESAPGKASKMTA